MFVKKILFFEELIAPIHFKDENNIYLCKMNVTG